MGRLQDVIAQIKPLIIAYKPISTVKLKKIVRENDSKRLEKRALKALDKKNRQHQVPAEDYQIRLKHPGDYVVKFFNNNTKQKITLTAPEGVWYDMALHYYNYITDYGVDAYTELGHYEIVKLKSATLAEESALNIGGF